MPRIMPEPRYFSMPSIDVGAEVLQKPRLELLAMGAVVDPFARRRDPLAGGDRRGVADDGHQIAMSACLRPQNAEAVLGVVEGDPLDEAGEHFLGRWFRLRLHVDGRINVSALRAPIPRHLEVTGPHVNPFSSGGVLVSNVIYRISPISGGPAICHHPAVQVFGSLEADGNDAVVTVPVAGLTANGRASDPIRQRKA